MMCKKLVVRFKKFCENNFGDDIEFVSFAFLENAIEFPD